MTEKQLRALHTYIMHIPCANTFIYTYMYVYIFISKRYGSNIYPVIKFLTYEYSNDWATSVLNSQMAVLDGNCKNECYLFRSKTSTVSVCPGFSTNAEPFIY